MIIRPSLLLAVLSLALPSLAQQADRIADQPESTPSIRLTGHVPRWANPAADAGPVPGDTPLHLTFVLARAPEQQAAFTQLLADQQDPASPRYHQWLTPQQAGDLYGPTQHDIAALTAWLATHGFTAAEPSPSRVFLTVTAPASAVSETLATSFRSFILAGEPHLSTTQDPALPAAFAAIVQSIAGLADTPIQPASHGIGMPAQQTPTEGSQPRYTTSSTTHYISPGDFANLFDLAVPYSAGLTGVGQRIAIIGRSRVVSTDITEFEANTGLAANLPTVVIPNPAYDPGVSGNGDEGEATLDVTRALGTAPSAQVDLVVLSNAGGGILSAAQYAVNTLNDPIMNISFGSCEIDTGSSGVKLWDTLFSQAASQGISVFVSASDSGAATCDTQFATPPSSQVRSINYICASSYATCVGGTELADTANPSQFWSGSNNASLVSTFAYIPEGAWNEPTTVTSGLTSYVAASGGGGVSLYIAKPTWQTGTGVPPDGARDVPDVSFPAAGHDGYYACYAFGDGDCSIGRFEYFYGTSAAAPSMAAITALVNQRTGARQGNFNPTLYRLAANPANNVFHDTTVESSGVANCSVATPSMCNNSTPSPISLNGGLAGFLLTPGYDQATGWGSIDGNNLLTALGPVQAATSISLTTTPAIVYSGNSVVFTAAVTPTGTGTPTGSVQFFLNGATLGPAVALPASGKATTPAIPFPTPLTDSMEATYSGDASFAVAKSPVVSLVVSAPGFSITVLPVTLSLTAGATTANSAALTYTSLGGFAGTISQFCTITNNIADGANYMPTCSYTAPSVILPAGGTVTGTITIGSTTPHVVLGTLLTHQAPMDYGSTLAGIAIASLFFLCLPGHRCRRPRVWVPYSTALAIAIALTFTIGCGGSGGGSQSSGPTTGSYTVTLTSSSGSTQATPGASIALTIQ